MAKYKTVNLFDINLQEDKTIMEQDFILRISSGIGCYNLKVKETKDYDIYYLFDDLMGTSINNFVREDLEKLNEVVPIDKGIGMFLFVKGWDKPLNMCGLLLEK
ncbi:hypothetical protein [Clostridium tertium]|uniref:hypothetical protein n=1 Tax=Clostridium tertium TaxID=1559 RepID=UPI0023B2B22B|nr:hypothetical protein [Clostridium tertium]